MKKIGITLIAGLALAVAAPAASAQAAAPRWTLVDSQAGVSYYACRIPESNGTTIKTYLAGDFTEVTVFAGLQVIGGGIVASVAVDEVETTGEVLVPAASGYSLLSWMAIGSETMDSYRSRDLSVTDLTHC